MPTQMYISKLYKLGTKGADASVEHLTYTVTAAIIPFCTAITKQ